MTIKTIIKSSSIAWKYRKFKNKHRIEETFQKINSWHDQNKLDQQSSNNKTVLIVSSVALFTDHIITEYLLAKELLRQGCDVKLFFCDKKMPICHAHDRYSCGTVSKNKILKKANNICDACSGNLLAINTNSDINIEYFINSSNTESLPNDYEEDVISGGIRYLASSNLDLPQKNLIFPLYRNAAKVAFDSFSSILEKTKPDLVIGHHGIYVPQGILNKVCKKKNISYYSWHFGYRKSTLIFSKGNTYHKELGSCSNYNEIKNNELRKIDDYLEKRRIGKDDWIHFNRNPKSHKAINNKERSKIIFYSSVDWDAALHFNENVYESQFDFVTHLIESARKNREHDYIIRVHPAEATGMHPSYTKLDRFIKKLSPPENLKVIPSYDTTSSYELAQSCNVAIVYNTKLGIELTSMGIPTIVAGESWVRDRGFTFDINSKEDLEKYLKNIKGLIMDQKMIKDAKSFAYYFYFKRCIDVPELKSTGNKFYIDVDMENCHDQKGMSLIAKKLLQLNDIEI